MNFNSYRWATTTTATTTNKPRIYRIKKYEIDRFLPLWGISGISCTAVDSNCLDANIFLTWLQINGSATKGFSTLVTIGAIVTEDVSLKSGLTWLEIEVSDDTCGLAPTTITTPTRRRATTAMVIQQPRVDHDELMVICQMPQTKDPPKKNKAEKKRKLNSTESEYVTTCKYPQLSSSALVAHAVAPLPNHKQEDKNESDDNDKRKKTQQQTNALTKKKLRVRNASDAPLPALLAAANAISIINTGKAKVNNLVVASLWLVGEGVTTHTY